jgi:hypothetical protein
MISNAEKRLDAATLDRQGSGQGYGVKSLIPTETASGHRLKVSSTGRGVHHVKL